MHPIAGGYVVPALINMAGQMFGRLVAVSPIRASNRIRWMCSCSCGNTVSVDASKLRSGNTKSCGCLRTERAGTHTLKHGHGSTSQSRTYVSWAAMLARCRHPDRNYANLTVCDRWLTFANFQEDMGERPEGMSIERKDNSVGYTPNNCVWADRTTQSCNRRNARLYEYGGQVKNLSTWCQELNLNYAKVHARLKRGATFVEAIT